VIFCDLCYCFKKGNFENGQKNILITGASFGIGVAYALLAAERGCNLAIHYHSNSDDIKLVKKKCTEIGISVQVLQGDLPDLNDINRIFSTVDNCSFRIDALIDNAGIVDKTARLDELRTLKPYVWS
jgi:short-subunit dehydrogenase